LTLLYVDDDVDDREIFREAIRTIDVTCDYMEASNGGEALGVLQTVLPDVVFFDVNMPGMNGKELLIRIRSNPRFQSMPVVMFSTAISPADELEYKNCGASYCLTKAASYPAFCEALRSFILAHINDARQV
jgi:CheY-like chemotaxis protein